MRKAMVNRARKRKRIVQRLKPKTSAKYTVLKSTLLNRIAPVEERMKVIQSIPGFKPEIRKLFYVSLFSLLKNRKTDYRLRLASAQTLLKVRAGKAFKFVTELAIHEAKSRRAPELKHKLAEQVIYNSKYKKDSFFLLELIKRYPSEEIKFLAAEHLIWIADPEKMLEAVKAIKSFSFSAPEWNAVIRDLINSAERKKPGITRKKI
jgi:hypothetical protein